MKKGLYHIILISFKPETPESIRDEVYDRYQTLADECGNQDAGILFWSVRKNLDLRKNIHLIEFAIFRDQKSLEQFKKHPKHIDLVTNLLSKVADWQVGNFMYT